jgi:hypothetical protein
MPFDIQVFWGVFLHVITISERYFEAWCGLHPLPQVCRTDAAQQTMCGKIGKQRFDIGEAPDPARRGWHPKGRPRDRRARN